MIYILESMRMIQVHNLVNHHQNYENGAVLALMLLSLYSFIISQLHLEIKFFMYSWEPFR